MLAALPASPQPPNPASSTGRRSPPGGSPKTSCIDRVYSLGHGGRTFPPATSGLDDQAARAPGLVAEHAEARQLVRIQPELVGKPLRVQRPSLDKGGAQPAGAQASKGG